MKTAFLVCCFTVAFLLGRVTQMKQDLALQNELRHGLVQNVSYETDQTFYEWLCSLFGIDTIKKEPPPHKI